MYKVLTNKKFIDEKDNLFEKVELHKKFNISGGQYIVETWQNSRKK